MSNNVFEDFLVRNKLEVISQFAKQMQKKSPIVSDEELPRISTQLVDFLIDRVLARIKVDDPLTQNLMSFAFAHKVSREDMLENRTFFFSVYSGLCARDQHLDQQQREHVERMLKQSQQFIMTDVLYLHNKSGF